MNHFPSIFSLFVMDKKRDAQLYLLMSTIGHYSLFPLLFTPAGNVLFIIVRNVRILHECQVWINKSVPRVTVCKL